MLKDIRGVEDVDEEFNDICAACKQANLVVNPWRNLLRPAYRPQLVISLTATLFQQWTGINTYARPRPQSLTSRFVATSLSDKAAMSDTCRG